MHKAEELASRIDRVTRVGSLKWRGCCPAHNSNNPTSLSITGLEDGRTLICCHAEQCSFRDILAAVGMTESEMLPEDLHTTHYRPVGPRLTRREQLSVDDLMIHIGSETRATGRRLEGRDLEDYRAALLRKAGAA